MKRKRATKKKPAKKKQKKLSREGMDKAKEIAAPQIERRSPRFAALRNRTSKPRLIFTAKWGKGSTKTQKLAPSQVMFFEQTAILKMTTGAVKDISHYYEFRQQVKDSWAYNSGAKQDLGDFEQDGPYMPPYGNSQTQAEKTQIIFKDEPGYSTTNKTEADDWLTSYEVYFRWIVTAKYGDGQTWTSPEVHHSLTSPYKGGADGPVTVVVASDEDWEVVLPDRIED